MMDIKALHKIESKTEKLPFSGCWIWMHGQDKDGYGQVTYAGKGHRSHRLAWSAINGPIPKGMWVLHHCDTPSCCNPYHLYVGTNIENVIDRHNRGRHRVQQGDEHYSRRNPGIRAGEKCPSHKLSKEEVTEVRKMIAEGITQPVIAKHFGVSRTAISAISTGRNWRFHTT